MLSAIRLDRVYHELIEKKVYRRENKVCMIHRCEECPGIHQLETYLETKLMSITDDEFAGFDDIEATEDKKEEIVTFKWWFSTYHADLITKSKSLSEFLAALSHQLDSITCHWYNAKSQARYLSKFRENLEEDTIIV